MMISRVQLEMICSRSKSQNQGRSPVAWIQKGKQLEPPTDDSQAETAASHNKKKQERPLPATGFRMEENESATPSSSPSMLQEAESLRDLVGCSYRLVSRHSFVVASVPVVDLD